jgi:hypothetical protein
MELFNSFIAPSLYNAYTGWGAPAAGACRQPTTLQLLYAAGCLGAHIKAHSKACLATVTQSPAGLDFVWPFLLHYPTNRIAVIDDICMCHPTNKTGSPSIYAAGRWSGLLAGCWRRRCRR